MARTLYDRANEIKTRHLSPQSVTGDKIANDAIEEKHIRDSSVTRAKIADGMIGPDELMSSAVETGKLAANSVTAEKIANQAITNEKLADGSVTNAKIADDSISTAKIRDGAITQAKLSFTPPSVARPITPAVSTDEIANSAVTSIKIADGAIIASKIATNTITQNKIANNAIGSGELQSNSVITEKLANGSVTPEKLSFTPVARPLTPPIATAEIGDGQVTQAKLAPGVGGGDTLTMLPAPVTALDFPGITATTQPATVDLSAIIPLNTKGVIVSIAVINQSYANGGMMAYIFSQLGAEYALQVMAPPVNAPGISNGGSVLMPVASDRTLLWQAYVSGNNSTELVIYILGYIV
ncbi:MAG: hypothetical protein HZA49_05535 [Planctomycetes bacterium]|nr:hypothetical protein [Planctomycetota bacterium]